MDFYKGNEGFIEFAVATKENAFGSQLLDILSKRFDSLPEAVSELTEALNSDEFNFGVDEDGVIDLLMGEVLPHPDLVDVLEGLAENEVEAKRLRNAAADSYDYLAALEDEEDEEDEEIDELEDEFVEDEDELDEDEATEEEDAETEEADADLAVALYSRQVIEDELNSYSDVADQMIAGGQGLMTPHIKGLLFGQNDKNRYANFSRVCESDGYSPEEYLKCIEFSLGLLSELGGIDSFYFSNEVNEDVADNLEFSSSRNNASDSQIETEAKAMLDLLNL